jgi:hypothetical protein
MEENTPDLKKVLQAGYLAKVSLYRQLLKKVANGASLCTSELRTLRDLGAELEALAKGEERPRTHGSDPAHVLSSLSRSDLAQYVFKVKPQSISRWVLHEGMPRNQDGTFCIADCVEWALERLEKAAPGAAAAEEAVQWLTAFRKERALKAKMEREELEGKLFPRGEVMAAWCNRYAHLKRHLLVWSRRLPGRLAGMDERGMIKALDEEVYFLLSLLSRPGPFTQLAGELEEMADV